MIQQKSNPNSPNYGLQLGDQESGCCVTSTTACKYKFVFATTPTAFTTVTIDGVAYAFAHTFTTTALLHAALMEVLTKPTSQGGAGLAVQPGDVKIYLDPFTATANRLTIEIISGVVFTNFITNVGTQTSETPVCTAQTMCRHILDYTLSDPIAITINNKALTLTTYATAALLRTAIDAQIAAQGLTGIAYARVRTSSTAGHADVWIYAKEGVSVYHDGTLIARDKCYPDYVA